MKIFKIYGITLLLASLVGCVNGIFVGTSYIPTKMYKGDKKKIVN